MGINNVSILHSWLHKADITNEVILECGWHGDQEPEDCRGEYMEENNLEIKKEGAKSKEGEAAIILR